MFKVTLSFLIDPTEYGEVESSKEAVEELVKEMLERGADLPNQITILVREEK